MTQIDFYTNVGDKLQTACRVAVKGYSLGRKIVMFCPDADVAQRLDRLLWTHPPTGFVPHCGAADPLASATPVIVDFRGDAPAHDQVLINLRTEWPAFFGRFERLVEIVSVEEEDRRQARERYKFYRDRGYEIRTHDLREGV
ncbi:MAG: DNA polymerase III subunit chi [Burkholderiales bacterium]